MNAHAAETRACRALLTMNVVYPYVHAEMVAGMKWEKAVKPDFCPSACLLKESNIPVGTRLLTNTLIYASSYYPSDC